MFLHCLSVHVPCPLPPVHSGACLLVFSMFSSCLYSHVAETLWVLEHFLLCPQATLRATKTFPLIASQQALRGCILPCSWLSPVCERARSFYGRCWGFPLSPRGFCGWQPGEMCTGLNYSLHSSWLHHTTGLSRRSHRALVKEGNPTLTHLVRSTVKSIHRKYQARLYQWVQGATV